MKIKKFIVAVDRFVERIWWFTTLLAIAMAFLVVATLGYKAFRLIFDAGIWGW